MDILIAGRSKVPPNDIILNTKLAFTPIRIHYDGTTDMSTSLENFYDMVWCKGCPIYTPFNPRADQVVGISLTQRVLAGAHRVLKVGGVFVMPLNPKPFAGSSLEDIMRTAKAIIVDPFEGRWSMESTKIADMPVHVKTKYKDAAVRSICLHLLMCRQECD